MIPRYRAWDKRNNKMRVVEAINFNRGEFESIGYGITSLRGADEIELMQSTGLKDKNGKEIFEGDILTSQNYPVKGVVESRTDLGLWVYYLKGYNYFEYLGNVAGSKEIIGNIYENPDLLEDNK